MTKELTNKQRLRILQQAVKKAVENGYKDKYDVKNLKEYDINSFMEKRTSTSKHNTRNNIGMSINIMDNTKNSGESSCDKVIFSDEFAQAFWVNKTNPITKGYKINGQIPHCDRVAMQLTKECDWECHRENIRKEKEPLIYINKFL